MSYIGNNPSQQAFAPAVDYFNGNASTVAFTLSRPVASVAQVQVTIENVPQNPSSSFTVSGSTITFTSAPPSGTSNIYVQYTSPITQVIAPGQGTVTATSMASSTGTGAGVFQTSPTITTPTISSLSSASATALTLQSAGTTAITVDTSQNVGIGTASPQFKFNVNQNTASPTASLQATPQIYAKGYAGSSTTYAGISFAMYEHTNGYWGSAILARDDTASYGSALTFYTSTGSATPSPTERMRIDSSGNLWFGTSTFSSSMQSGLSLQTASNSQLWVSHANGTGSGQYYAGFFYNGSVIGGVTQNGTTAVAYNTSSDYRLKDNIAPMTGALDKIALLKPVTYKWKIDGSDGQGFIAHELAEVVPDCVSGEKDAVDEEGKPKYQGIDTSFLVATLTAAIQEQQALIIQLQADVSALKGIK